MLLCKLHCTPTVFLKSVLYILQVGLAEAKVAVDQTGGMIVMAETFDSEQFKKSLQRLFDRDEEGLLKMFFNASVEVMTTKEVKVCGVIGPCSSSQKKGAPPYPELSSFNIIRDM